MEEEKASKNMFPYFGAGVCSGRNQMLNKNEHNNYFDLYSRTKKGIFDHSYNIPGCKEKLAIELSYEINPKLALFFPFNLLI